MTLLMWRNHFTCDILAEKGTAHISSLCKWGPSTFTHRVRILPSGRPPEEAVTLVQDDPTWAPEYAHFKTLCQERRQTDLSNDLWLNRTCARSAPKLRRRSAHDEACHRLCRNDPSRSRFGNRSCRLGFRTVAFDPTRHSSHG